MSKKNIIFTKAKSTITKITPRFIAFSLLSLVLLLSASGVISMGFSALGNETADISRIVTVSDENNPYLNEGPNRSDFGAEISLLSATNFDISETFPDLMANPLEFYMPSDDVSITARFVSISNQLTIGLPAGGSVDFPRFSFQYEGTEIRILATTEPGFGFFGWSMSGIQISDRMMNPLIFDMPANGVSLTPNFLPVFNLTVNSGIGGEAFSTPNNNEDGSPGGHFLEGTTVDITSVPNDGYRFDGWDASGITLTNPMANPIRISMPRNDVVVTANYAKIRSLIVNTSTGGIVSGANGGVHDVGTQINLLAEASAGYQFTHWSATGLTLSGSEATSENLSFLMPDADVVITANFSASSYTLTVNAGVGGTVTGSPGGGYTEGTSINLTSVADIGYRFAGWEASGITISDLMANPLLFSMPDNDVVVTAKFVRIRSLAVNYGIGGSISGDMSGTYDVGTPINLIAEADIGYHFMHWTASGMELSESDRTSEVLQFLMPDADVVITAHFSLTITTNALTINASAGGFVTGTPSGNYEAGTPINLEPVAEGDYQFAGWEAEGISLPNPMANPLLFDMPGNDVVITARFVRLFNLTVSAGAGGRVTGTPSGSYAEGTPISLVPVANSGFRFDGWDVTVGSQTTQLAYDFDLDSLAGTVNGMFAAAYLEQNITPLGFIMPSENTVPEDNADNNNTHQFMRLSAVDSIFHDFPTTNGSVNIERLVFNMPANDVALIAHFASIGGSGGNNNWPYVPSTPNVPPGDTAGDTIVPEEVESDSDPPSQTGYEGFNVAEPEPLTTPPTTGTHLAYVFGRGNNMFWPNAQLTRAEAAQIFLNLLDVETTGLNVHFSDVDNGAWYARTVNTMADLGFISGYPDGTFRPNMPISRAEFAVMAMHFEQISPGISMQKFTDVPNSHWAHRYINSAAYMGWISGVGNNLFEPDRNITRAEAVTLVNRALGRTPDEVFIGNGEIGEILLRFSDISGHWAYYQIIEASNTHQYHKSEDGLWEHWLLVPLKGIV